MLLAIILFVAPVANADESTGSDRPNLSGTWNLDLQQSDNAQEAFRKAMKSKRNSGHGGSGGSGMGGRGGGRIRTLYTDERKDQETDFQNLTFLRAGWNNQGDLEVIWSAQNGRKMVEIYRIDTESEKPTLNLETFISSGGGGSSIRFNQVFHLEQFSTPSPPS